MKLFSRRMFAAPLLMFAVAFVSTLAISKADEENVYWRSAAGNGYWATSDMNNWYRANDGWDVQRPDLATGQWAGTGTKSYTTIHFDNGNQTSMTINAYGGAKYYVYRILLENSSSRTFTSIDGAYLSLGGGGGAPKIESVSGSGTGTYTFNVPIFLEKDAEINAVGGNIIVNGAITNNGKTLISYTDTGKELQLNGIISGSGAFQMKGSGLVTLSGTNTYSGGTLVNSGEVKGTTTSLQGNITNNAKLTFDQATNGSYSGAISGTGAVNKAGAGTTTLSGTNSYTGTTTVETGALRAASASALGSSAGGTIVSTLSALELTGGITISGEALSIADDGIGEAGALRNISGDNTWTGTVSVATAAVSDPRGGRINSDAGTLTISGAISAAASTTTIYVGGAANTVFSGTVASTNTSGDGALYKDGAGTLTLSGASANTINGRTTVAGGKLILDKTAGTTALAGAVKVQSGATLLINKSNQVSDSSAVTLSGGTIQRASGVSEVFGNLELTSASFLDYGSGTAGTLQFGTYTPSSLLTVNNFFKDNKLVFSGDMSSTINNTNYFKFSGAFTTNYSGGLFTITAIPEPSACTAAAGLIALMLWPMRKRRALRASGEALL